MAKRGLISFVKDECANYDHYYGGCLFAEKCKVVDSKKPCKYFERAVLGTPDYKYRLSNYDYEKLFEQYSEINLSYQGQGIQVRRCECGEPLQKGRQCCVKCREKRKRESWRKSQRLRRLGVNSSLKNTVVTTCK